MEEDVVGYVQVSVLVETENGTECLVAEYLTQTKRTNGFASHDMPTPNIGIQSGK